MNETRCYAAHAATSPLVPFQIGRREPGPNDVDIDITYCGVCHSDLHQVRNEWGGATYPMVPGHEIIGKVRAVGKSVKRFRVGDSVGVGCMVDSCRVCVACEAGLQPYCDGRISFTYNSTLQDGTTPTHGGYSQRIVVDENYVLRVAESLPAHAAAPLLCAGITTYSPLRKWKVGHGQRVGIVGLGGLGHMGVKFAVAMGAEVTLISSSDKKREDAKRLGAQDYVVSSDEKSMQKLAGRFDFILDTVSADHDLAALLNLLRTDATLCLVGAPDKPAKVPAFSLIGKRRTLAGSLIGGIPETQEMLDFCAERGITSDVEVIAASDIGLAYDRMLKSDVRYRFVIDTSTIG